ncbi:uncharacterized [Tachysurus ichikawai]
MRSSLCAGDYASVYVQLGVRKPSASFIQSVRGAQSTTDVHWLPPVQGADLWDAEQKRHVKTISKRALELKKQQNAVEYMGLNLNWGLLS